MARRGYSFSFQATALTTIWPCRRSARTQAIGTHKAAGNPNTRATEYQLSASYEKASSYAAIRRSPGPECSATFHLVGCYLSSLGIKGSGTEPVATCLVVDISRYDLGATLVAQSNSKNSEVCRKKTASPLFNQLAVVRASEIRELSLSIQVGVQLAMQVEYSGAHHSRSSRYFFGNLRSGVVSPNVFPRRLGILPIRQFAKECMLARTIRRFEACCTCLV